MIALSRRETQVRDLLLQGLCNKQMARVIGISVKTVESHRARMMEKTGAANVVALVRAHCMPSDEATRLAVEIADEDAWLLIQCECPLDAGWYDTSNAEALDYGTLKRDLRYLALRGLIETHPKHPHLVRLRADPPP